MSAHKPTESSSASLAILGGGNLGRALARGWVRSGTLRADQIHVTRRRADGLEELAGEGFPVGTDNRAAIQGAGTVLIAVQPQQIADLLDEIRDDLDPGRHTVISVVSGVDVAQLREMIPAPIPVVRAMPNTAVSIGESMTCLSADPDSIGGLDEAETLFDGVGLTLRIVGLDKGFFASAAMAQSTVAKDSVWPSTARIWPLIMRAWGEARKTAASAMSRAWTKARIETWPA